MLTVFIYFIGVILVWIIGILYIKYCGEFDDIEDLEEPCFALIGFSLLSWIIVIVVAALTIIVLLQRFIVHKLGNWILKDKKEDPFRYHG